ncbi:MAG TPA: Crp/Fnr family transcriptional regulator [Anaerolineales bacterium]|nr:Crp/Fnr family transcriptional regulator [Anaerolineales bacterium]
MSRVNLGLAPKSVIASTACFSGLTDDALIAIAAITTLHHFEQGEIVFLEGDPCNGLYIVQDGWLKSLLVSPGGREQIIRLVGPGETFNEHGVFLKEGLNLVTVQTVEDSHVWLVDRNSLLALMEKYPVLCRTILQNMAARIVHLMRLVEDLSLRTVESRLARLLLEQSAGESDRRRWATQAEMAARLGTVVDVVNRALHKLEDQGLIRIVRHKIEIMDRVQLEQAAERRD